MNDWEKRYYLSGKWRIVGTYKNNHKPPSISCVYLIFIDDYSNFTRDIQYIGQTNNCYKRFSCHRTYFKIKKLILDKNTKDITVKIKYANKKDRKQLEKKLIQRLKPPYNKFYNWGYL